MNWPNSTTCWEQTVAEIERTAFYDPAENDYDLSKDPRCLWGWGDCAHRHGHACFRPYGHKGVCWDAGEPPDRDHQIPCDTSRRPKNWDASERAAADRG